MDEVFNQQSFTIWHVNIQGLRSHVADLVGRIRLATNTPHLLCLNETFLDQSIGDVAVEGYDVVARWDRAKERGGVCVYACKQISENVTLMMKSVDAERVWCMVHTERGPYVLGAWYRPPNTESSTIETCEKEHDDVSSEALGTLLVGDLNVHHVAWLTHSRETTPNGKNMRLAAAHMGLTQLVHQPTRGKYLLDLVLSDIPGTRASVLAKIADHSVVEIIAPLPVPEVMAVEREIWKFGTADWERLEALLEEEDWADIQYMCPDEGAKKLSETLLCHASSCIKKKRITEEKSSHPWLNDEVLRAVASKRDAEGTTMESQKTVECSNIVKQEYDKWTAKLRGDLVHMKTGSKAWWKQEKQLQLQKQRCSSIPALRNRDGDWIRDSEGKANLLATTLAGKYKLAAIKTNQYSSIGEDQLDWLVDRAALLNPDAAKNIMAHLREDSAAGPDRVPTRIIKQCACALATPVYLLAMAILTSGRWPDLYTLHWVACLYKKKSVSDPKNYRGVHLTAQLAKVLERLIGLIFLPKLSCPQSIGSNQFAYTKERGARDAVAYLVLSWLRAFKEKASVALYMSDVSGAFDRVSATRLLAKLQARGMPDDVIKVIQSWLRKRTANIIVSGEQSKEVHLQDMVFQGTVWGPPLWNSFYADSRHPIQKHDFQEIIFADDLNAWKKFEAGTAHDTMLAAMQDCQHELHQWGSANQVSFDADKEGKYVLSRRHPHGDNFNLLGIHFDCKLVMSGSVEELAKACRWKVKAILRTRKFNNGAGLISLYKAQVLSYIEYRTAAIYHACSSALALLDAVQDKVISAAGITKWDALHTANLAPLGVRRDIAMLGVIHRSVLGRGPVQFREIFKADLNARRDGRGAHGLQLLPLPHHASDFILPGSAPAQYIENSAYGLIRVYNMLPASVVEASSTVSNFQSALQDLVKYRASQSFSDWEFTLSPRIPGCRHPLRRL